MTTPCNHHDPTGKDNYFRNIKTLEYDVQGEYIMCKECYKKWIPDKKAAQPTRDNVAIDSSKNQEAFNSYWSKGDKELKEQMRRHMLIIKALHSGSDDIRMKEWSTKEDMQKAEAILFTALRSLFL